LAELHENVLLARSGNEALHHMAARQFAVILLDVKMPGLNGFETAKLIRHRKEWHAPIIFVTAYGQDDAELRQSYCLGAVDYIQMPVIPQILRAKVEVFVELQKKNEKIEKQASELRRSLAELTQTNRELETVCYSLSHDLRSPLRAINNFTSIVLEDCGRSLDESGRDLLKRVVAAANRMERLMQDLLSLSRVSRQEIQLALVDPEKLAKEIICEEPAFQLPNAQIEIETPLLPMKADEASLTQCLTNLLGNAVKFVAPGIVPQVRVYSRAVGANVRLWFEDNGSAFLKTRTARFLKCSNVSRKRPNIQGKGLV
jgi:two-component system sensor histidine kinase/response regulator